MNLQISTNKKSKHQKILIMELWGIGDIVMMSSILRCLREAFPTAQISVLCQKHGQEILKENSDVDNFFIFKFPWTVFRGKYRFWEWDWKGMMKTIKSLRREKFDLTIDARGDLRNNILLFLTGAKRRIGYNWTGGGYFLTDVIHNGCKDKHRIDAWRNILAYLGLKTRNIMPKIYISDAEKQWADFFLKEKGISNRNILIGIHPGARIKLRCWPLERFAAVAEYIQKQYSADIILFIDPDNYGENIVVKAKCVRVKVNLRQLVSLINKLDLLICNDTGVMHIATAVNTPVVAVFGPGDADKIGPYGDKHSVVIKKDVKCRPCSDYCRYKEPFCITDISPEEVIKDVDIQIKKTTLSKK